MNIEQKIVYIAGQLTFKYGNCQIDRYADRVDFFFNGQTATMPKIIIDVIPMDLDALTLRNTLKMAGGLVEMFINRTPTGEFRNKLCDMNLEIQKTLQQYKDDKFPKDNLEDLKEMNKGE